MAKDLKVEHVKSLTADEDLLQIRMVKFNDKPRLDIRKFYEDRVTGELKPTGKGIALDHEMLAQVVTAIREHGPEIQKFITPKGVKQIDITLVKGEGKEG